MPLAPVEMIRDAGEREAGREVGRGVDRRGERHRWIDDEHRGIDAAEIDVEVLRRQRPVRIERILAAGTDGPTDFRGGGRSLPRGA